MAKRGTAKRKSQDQERYVAAVFGGAISPSSGGAVTDGGDVRTDSTLIECKATGGPGQTKEEERPSLNRILEWLAKINEEAIEEGRDPALALRLWAPDHPLSHLGWLDLVIMEAGHAGTLAYVHD